ncbi:MAG TPA: hypothetical protein VLM38_24775 [Blastocatellia bacterium]|nr:hypothetical protein [Blastocatellia bacterium]
MKTQKPISGFVFVSLFVCLLGISAMAQVQKVEEPVAAIASDSTEIRFQPQGEYGRLILTVSAPNGEVFRKEFEGGAAPSFKLIDQKGLTLPDGQYTYELRVVPKLSREARKALAASREAGNSAEVIQELQKNGQLPATITVQSGSFLIEKGVVFAGAPEESAEPRVANPSEIQSKKRGGGGTVTIQDVVTADDVIIQGSACVGIDCVNNENFGFDTIRLKENNTRIQFDDTSTSAGFATNNWQIRANSSASGGSSFLGFVDQGATGNSETGTIVFSVAAGAPANSLFVSSAGKVGLRTSTPVLDLHITSGDTPAHRLEQTGAGGFTAQTWDVAGNEANFFVRDVTGGSRLPFRIRPGAPTSSIDISASGNVGIGIQSPSAALHIGNNGPQWSSFNYGTNLVLKDGTTARNPSIGIFDAANANPWAIVNVLGVLKFSQMPALGNTATAAVEKLVIDTSGNVGIGTTTPGGKLDVNGTIFQRGLLLHADYVFEPTYNLESIEEHAAFMWDNKHLPALGSRTVDQEGREVVEIGARMRGLLEELEKAHIYIANLNDKVAQKDEQMAKLERQNAELAERLSRIEALLSSSKPAQK